MSEKRRKKAFGVICTSIRQEGVVPNEAWESASFCNKKNHANAGMSTRKSGHATFRVALSPTAREQHETIGKNMAPSMNTDYLLRHFAAETYASMYSQQLYMRNPFRQPTAKQL
jgi:hypothetical protein